MVDTDISVYHLGLQEYSRRNSWKHSMDSKAQFALQMMSQFTEKFSKNLNTTY
jgi:hypothetical protein